VTLKGQTRDPHTSVLGSRIGVSKTALAGGFKFGRRLCRGECRAGAQIIFPESGRDLGHATQTIFGIRSNISP